MDRQRFGVADVSEVRKELQAVDDLAPRCAPALDAEPDQCALAPGQIFLGQFVRTMRRQPRIVDPLDFGVFAQEACYAGGVLAVAIQPQAQRFDALQELKRVERRQRRAEIAQAAESAPPITEAETAEATGQGVWEPAPDAPFDAAVAEVDSSAFAEQQNQQEASPFEIPPLLPAEEEAPTTVRELFARMDRARPRPPSSVTPRPLSRLRSDFAPMPDPGEAAGAAGDDPFAFPDAPRPDQRVARTSGPQPTFNPSTADIDDFEAWLRGLKGP